MAIVCPHCTMPVFRSAEILQSAGRTLRCARCGTTWFARPQSADRFARRSSEPAYQPLGRSARRFERIIEHGDHGRSPDRRGRGFARRLFGGWLGVITLGMIGGVIVAMVLHSVAGASSRFETAQFPGNDSTFRSVLSTAPSSADEVTFALSNG